MPIFNAVISQLVIGDDWTIGPMSYALGVPAQIQDAYLVIKKDPSLQDGVAGTLKLHVTTVNSASGQIEDNGSISRVCTVHFTLTSAQTGALFQPGLYYAYAIKLVTTLGLGYTPEEGMILPQYRGVTSA